MKSFYRKEGGKRVRFCDRPCVVRRAVLSFVDKAGRRGCSGFVPCKAHAIRIMEGDYTTIDEVFTRDRTLPQIGAIFDCFIGPLPAPPKRKSSPFMKRKRSRIDRYHILVRRAVKGDTKAAQKVKDMKQRYEARI